MSVKDSPGKAPKMTKMRIPIQITDNFTSSLYSFSTAIVCIFKIPFFKISELLYFTIFRITAILLNATDVGLNTTG